MTAPRLAAGWDTIPPGYRSPAMIDERQHCLDLIVTPAATVFRFTEVVDFFVLDEGITYQLHDPTTPT